MTTEPSTSLSRTSAASTTLGTLKGVYICFEETFARGAVTRRWHEQSSLTTSHIVKYDRGVHIVTRKHLNQAAKKYPDAAKEIGAWVAIVKEVRWHNFPEIRGTFKDADNVKGYVIFNIRQNRYRLVTVVHYAKTTKERQTQGHVYIRSFLTHKEYDNPANWDRRFGTK
jgi:mRNA interferase HigB